MAFDVNSIKGFLTAALRIRVQIDIAKPLLRCVTIEGPRKQSLKLRLTYEKLPNCCYFCGTLGHLVKDCSRCLHLVDHMGSIDESKLEYGDWLRANKKL